MGAVSDFILNTQSPIGQFAQTYNQLQPIRQGIENIRAQRAEAERRRHYNNAFQNALQTRNPEDWMQVYQMTPEAQRESFAEGWNNMTQQEQQAQLTQMSEVVSAFDSGATEVGMNLLDSMAMGYENSGDLQTANNLRSLMTKAQSEPRGLEVLQGYLTQKLAGMPGAEQYLENIYSVGKEQRERMATEADLLKTANELEFATPEDKARAMETADGYSMETAKALIDLASVRSLAGGGTEGWKDSNEFFKAEQALRKEYDSFVEPYNTVVNNANIIANLAKQGTGFSDQGMIMAFNKVLDPGSVVRESEARMTAENQSVANRGRTLLAAIEAGERLSPDARMELLQAVQIMSDLAQGEIASKKDNIMETVTFNGFGVDRIFAKSTAPTGETETEVTETQTDPQVNSFGIATIGSEGSTPLTEAEVNEEAKMVDF